jgi:hypothetical protein
MSKKLGFSGKLYYSTTLLTGTPSWTEIPMAGDITPTDEKVVAQINDRSSTAVEEVHGRFTLSWDCQITFDPGHAAFAALRAAYIANTPLAFFIADGGSGVNGTEGWQADCQIRSFPRAEPLDDVMTVAMRISPYPTGDPPQYVVVSGS